MVAVLAVESSRYDNVGGVVVLVTCVVTKISTILLIIFIHEIGYASIYPKLSSSQVLV